MPAPGLTYRTIGGVLDLYFFLGPAPEAAIQQYLTSVGLPVMVPYWALGFQLCRFGYESIDDMKEAVDRMRQYNIPHDIQYGDIDYMYQYRDFTIDPVNFNGLPEYVQQLKQDGTRYVIILDPALWNDGTPGEYPPLDRGTDMDVWIKDSQGGYQEGVVWPGPTYFPDFTNPNTEVWWGDEAVLFKEQLDYAGLWIDMNEPASFSIPEPCANNRWNYPMFTPSINGDLLTMTICMDNQQYLGQHYNVHSLYGWSMAKQTLPVARRVENNEKRGMVYSRSTYPGAGAWGQHWLGDNDADWAHLRWSIIGMMEFNMLDSHMLELIFAGFSTNPLRKCASVGSNWEHSTPSQEITMEKTLHLKILVISEKRLLA
jgi:alpha-glucosidase (family GH31 glycosyl hydrolase)